MKFAADFWSIGRSIVGNAGGLSFPLPGAAPPDYTFSWQGAKAFQFQTDPA